MLCILRSVVDRRGGSADANQVPAIHVTCPGLPTALHFPDFRERPYILLWSDFLATLPEPGSDSEYRSSSLRRPCSQQDAPSAGRLRIPSAARRPPVPAPRTVPRAARRSSDHRARAPERPRSVRPTPRFRLALRRRARPPELRRRPQPGTLRARPPRPPRHPCRRRPQTLRTPRRRARPGSDSRSPGPHQPPAGTARRPASAGRSTARHRRNWPRNELCWSATARQNAT
jgi:hypothetical protein